MGSRGILECSLFIVFELCIRRDGTWGGRFVEAFLPVGSLPMDGLIHRSHILLIGRQYLNIVAWLVVPGRKAWSECGLCTSYKKFTCDVLATHMLFKSSNSIKNIVGLIQYIPVQTSVFTRGNSFRWPKQITPLIRRYYTIVSIGLPKSMNRLWTTYYFLRDLCIVFSIQFLLYLSQIQYKWYGYVYSDKQLMQIG